MKKIDLHIHTNLSDGDLSSTEIIDLALKNNCHMISITDHDHIMDDKLYENNRGIKIIKGVELNSTIQGMHILGYGLHQPIILNERLKKLNLSNQEVCLEVIRLLQKDGFDISKEQIEEYYKSLYLPCDIIDKKKIVKYLIYKNYTKGVLETYNTLIGKGMKYYVPIDKMTPRECIEKIAASGGISVLAHPATLNLSNEELYFQIKKLTSIGLDGIEIINQKMPTDKTDYYHELANLFNLIETVGSDFHSLTKQGLGIQTSEQMVYKFEEKIEYARKRIRS